MMKKMTEGHPEHKRGIYFIIMFIGVLFITGCEDDKKIKKWFNQIGQLKNEVQKEIKQVPYRDNQYQVFQNYFSKINNVIFSLENDSSLMDAFNSFIEENSLSKLCPKVFISQEDWQMMIVSCRKNNFFLCPEEVRAYPDAILKIRSYLDPKQQRQFDGIDSCKVTF